MKPLDTDSTRISSRRPIVKKMGRVFAWTSTFLALLGAAGYVTATYWLMPKINQHPQSVSRLLSQKIGKTINIGEIKVSWDRIWPYAKLSNVKIQVSKDRVITIPRLTCALQWRSVFGTPYFHHLSVSNLKFSVRRTKENKLLIAGHSIDLNADGAKSDTAEKAFTWFLEHRRVRLENFAVRYIDENETEHPVKQFKKITFVSQHKGNGQKLSIDCQYDEKPVDAQLAIDDIFNSGRLDWKSWSGSFSASLANIDIARTLRGTFMSPFVVSGFGSSRFSGTFKNARITSVEGDADFKSLDLRLGDNLKPLKATNFKGHFSERLENGKLSFGITGLHYLLPNAEKIGPLDFSGIFTLGNADEQFTNRLELSRVNLGVLRRNLIDCVPIPKKVKDDIVRYAPRGTLQNLALTWRGSLTEPRDWSLKTDFGNLGLLSVPNQKPTIPGIPGFGNLSGSLEATATQGSLRLDTKNGSLDFPGVFEYPKIPVSALNGLIRWSVDPQGVLTCHSDRLEIVNNDLSVLTHGSWNSQGGTAGTIDLNIEVNRLLANRAYRYMPLVIDEDTRQWLEAGIVGGVAFQGKGVLKGELEKFPWTNGEKDSLFSIQAKLRDGEIDYIPCNIKNEADQWITGIIWPTLKKIEGTLDFTGASMLIKAKHAETMDCELTDVTASIPNLSDGEKTTLICNGEAAGNLSNMLQYLRKSPVGGYLGHAFDKATGSGEAKLKLGLTIPLLHARDTLVEGEIALKNNRFDMKWPVPELDHLYATLRFTQSGVDGEHITATAFGEPVTASVVTTRETGSIDIGVSGSIDMRSLAFFHDTALVKTALAPLSGVTPFVANVSIHKGVTVTAQSNLTNVVSRYPAPMDKAPNVKWPTKFLFTPISIRGKNGNLLNLKIADKFDMSLQLPEADSRLPFFGAIGIGTKAKYGDTGLELNIEVDKAQEDSWTPIVTDLITAAGSDSKDGSQSTLKRVTVKANQVMVGELPFTNVNAVISPVDKNTWRTAIQSSHVSGVLDWNFQAKPLGTITGSFSRLHIPNKTKENIKTFLAKHQNNRLPNLAVTARDFMLNGKKLGTLSIQAKNKNVGDKHFWEIEKGTLKNRHAELTLSSVWNDKNQTSINAKLHVADGGKLLSDLGFTTGLEKTKGMILANLSWNDAPWKPQTQSLDGNVSFDLTYGVLNQVDTGLGGALLSLVSFQSLIKRLTLDFFDLTHSGYTFDAFTGDIKLDKGIAATENLKLAGPKASVMISGKADFTQESIDAKALVVPDINAGGASLALAFLNPAVGLGTFATQWLLSGTIGKLFATEYSIVGNIYDPKITKREQPRPSESKSATE